MCKKIENKNIGFIKRIVYILMYNLDVFIFVRNVMVVIRFIVRNLVGIFFIVF